MESLYKQEFYRENFGSYNTETIKGGGWQPYAMFLDPKIADGVEYFLLSSLEWNIFFQNQPSAWKFPHTKLFLVVAMDTKQKVRDYLDVFSNGWVIKQFLHTKIKESFLNNGVRCARVLLLHRILTVFTWHVIIHESSKFSWIKIRVNTLRKMC